MNRSGPGLDDMIAMISHDLRTPLSVVQTTVSMLLNPKYQLSPQQVREQHERIRRNADLMNRIVGELADMGALRAGKLPIDLKPVAINDVLRDAVSAQETPSRDKGVALTFDTGPDAMQADADHARLLQVFRNLLGSAIRNCKAGDRIVVTSHARDGLAQIEIADSGPGIAAADLPHVFDPHYVADKKHLKAGTGLGLYLARGIVEAHGGEIRCESGPGGGTTFRISLPLTS